MARIEGEIILYRPVEEVFAFVADERNEPRYNPRMVSAELTSGEPIGPGSRFRAELKTGRRTMPMMSSPASTGHGAWRQRPIRP